jgi:hypothetical protein
MRRPEAIAEALEKLSIGELVTFFLSRYRSTVLTTSVDFAPWTFRLQGKRTCGHQKWKNEKDRDAETFVSIRPTSKSLHMGMRPFV